MTFPTCPKKLERYLRYLGAAPQKKWGQNFLLDNKYHLEIVKTAQLSKNDVVLEIGSGLGHLTYFLQPLVYKLWLAEIDPIMVKALGESFKEADNIEIVNIDVLKKKTCLNPELMEKIKPFLENNFKVVANLPYNISAPIIMNFLKCEEKPSLMALTVQKEIAERLVAEPATEFYGPLTVQAQLRSKIKIINYIPPQAFFPAPKVTSAIIEVTPQEMLLEKVQNIDLFEKLVQATFCLRRKKLSNSLVHGGLVSKNDPNIEKIESQFDLSRRPETFSVDEFIALANLLDSCLGNTLS